MQNSIMQNADVLPTIASLTEQCVPSTSGLIEWNEVHDPDSIEDEIHLLHAQADSVMKTSLAWVQVEKVMKCTKLMPALLDKLHPFLRDLTRKYETQELYSDDHSLFHVSEFLQRELAAIYAFTRDTVGQSERDAAARSAAEYALVGTVLLAVVVYNASLDEQWAAQKYYKARIVLLERLNKRRSRAKR